MKKHIFLLFLFLSGISMAQTTKEASTSTLPKAQVAESKQSVTLDGKVIPLLAKAGTMELKDENNRPIALFGFTAYFKENPEKNRPIVFAFNGGPGSSSYWLHQLQCCSTLPANKQ
jgi:carboxypeptidase C (cathepsin A)